MVEWAKHLEQDGLRFFTAIEDAVQWLGGVDLLHSNGVLQYLDAPEAMLERLLALKSRHVLWGRMLLGESRATEIQISPLSDHWPGPAPPGFVDRGDTQTRSWSCGSSLRAPARFCGTFLQYTDRVSCLWR